MCVYQICSGRDSSAGIATRFGLDDPGIESRGGARFSAPVQTGPGAYPASYTMGTGSFPGVKRPGRGADHPPPSKCRGHERVELYLYSPLWAFMACYRENLYLYIYLYSPLLAFMVCSRANFTFYFTLQINHFRPSPSNSATKSRARAYCEFVFRCLRKITKGDY